MLSLTAQLLAIVANGSPAARRLMASDRWKGDSFSLRPNFTPLAIARLRPSPVRSRISSALELGDSGEQGR